MSLFDEPKQEALSDAFPLNTLFLLLGAHYDGVQPTSYGSSEQASIIVAPTNDEKATKLFRVWGSLAIQVKEMEDGDIPAEVEVTKLGMKKIFRLSKKIEGEPQNTIVPDQDTSF